MASPMQAIEERLTLAKKDKSKCLDPELVLSLFTEFQTELESVHDPEQDPNAKELLQIFSLAFAAVGLGQTVPGHYAILVTLERLLAHLELRPMYTIHESKVVQHRLKRINEVVSSPEIQVVEVSPQTKAMVQAKLDICFSSLAKIDEVLATIAEEDIHLYTQVVHLRREIFNTVIDPDFKAKHLTRYRQKVDQITLHTEGRSTSWLVMHHLESSRFMCDYYRGGPREIETLEPEYNELLKINQDLALFVVTQRWTLRETDLYQYQVRVQDLDQRVVSALKATPFFVYPNPNATAEEIQAIYKNIGPYILQFFLVRKAHSNLYRLLDSAEPVAESLSQVYNQLVTCKRCLQEVRDLGGLSNLQELYPYQMKLSSIEKRRVDGKFIADGQAPPGQGILNSLLAECYDYVYELEVDLEERPQHDGDDDDADDDDNDNESD